MPVNQLITGGWMIDPEDVATLSPLITSTIRRFGDWHLDLTPPETTGDGRLAVPIDRHRPPGAAPVVEASS